MRDLAIRNTHSTVVSIRAETDAYDNNGNVVVLDEALIEAEVSRLQAIYDDKQYARDRAKAYALLNQFEMQFDDLQNNTTTWQDAINEIKGRFPK